MKFKIRKKIYKFLNSKTIDLLYVFIVILSIYLIDTLILKKGFNFRDYFELKLVTSLSATYFLAVFFKWISKKIEKKIEDGMKLTTDYISIIKQYKGNIEKMICHIKNDTEIFNIDKSMLVDDEIFKSKNHEIYPIIMEYVHYPENKIEIVDDPNKQYEIPKLIEANFISIFNSHKHSKVYNSINIRLDDLEISDKVVRLVTSRTTYFNSLVTNRAMDHMIDSAISIRKLFEFENKISVLQKSKLSNHIGINGSILTTDNKIVFIKRFSNVSIGKNILGNSLGASLKTKYCIDQVNGMMSLSGLEKGIRSELKDELGLDNEHYKFSFADSMVGIYRDLVEGGKPQILIACQATIDSHKMKSLFEEKKKAKKNKNNLIVDGNKLVFIDINQISTTKTAIYDVAKNTKYETIPTVSASTLMTINWFNGEKIW